MPKYKADDLSLLVPACRERVEQLEARMLARGFGSVVRDTKRSREEAAQNAAEGDGIADSMHCYGVAADLICAEHGWSCSDHGCGYFEALHIEAHAVGLVRVRLRNPKTGKLYWDRPHVQAIPVRLQNAVRALGEDSAAIDALVRRYQAGRA